MLAFQNWKVDRTRTNQKQTKTNNGGACWACGKGHARVQGHRGSRQSACGVCIFDHLPSLSSLALFFAFVVFFDLLFSVLFVGPQNLTRRTMRWKQKYPRIEHTRRKWFTPICAFESVYPHIHTYANAYTHTHTQVCKHPHRNMRMLMPHLHAVVLSFACLLSVCTCVCVFSQALHSQGHPAPSALQSVDAFCGAYGSATQ